MVSRNPKARGFGLLEAIVALVILAGAGAALFDWIRQNQQAVARLDATGQRALLLVSAQDALSTIDPNTQPEGRLRAGTIELRWQSTLAAPELANATALPPATGPHRVGLHRVRAVAVDETTGIRVEFDQLLVSTRRIDAPQLTARVSP